MNQSQRPALLLRLLVFAAAIAVVISLLYRGITWLYSIPQSGFGPSRINNLDISAKTLWDWLDLLIVPVVLGVIGLAFERTYRTAQRRSEDEKYYDTVLRTYTERLSDVLLPRLTAPPARRRGSKIPAHYDQTRQLIQASTLSTLREIDPKRKAIVLQFLKSLGLIRIPTPIIDLTGADLRWVSLSGLDLSDCCLAHADLEGASTAIGYALRIHGRLPSRIRSEHLPMCYAILDGADLQGANLTRADLSFCSIRNAVLDGADLRGSKLLHSDLRNARLRRVHLHEASLIHTDFADADLQAAVFAEKDPSLLIFLPVIHLFSWIAGIRAYTRPAKINKAVFWRCDLSDARMTNRQLMAVRQSASETTLPDGTMSP